MNIEKITAYLLSEYEANLRQQEKSEATIRKYMRDVKAFEKYVGKTTVTKSKVMDYKEQLLQQYEISSANSMIAAINSFFSFAGWQHCKVKQFKVQQKVFCSEQKEISRAEYERLCQAAQSNGKEQLYLILQTICATGIRVSELRYITAENIQKGYATVRCKGKTRKVFIVKKLQTKLMCYAKKHKIASGPVFVTHSGAEISRTTVWRQMKSICRQAGVDPQKVFPHNLRHLFARIYYKLEKDIAKLADILGHSNINTTRLYIISTGKEHQRHLEKMRLII